MTLKEFPNGIPFRFVRGNRPRNNQQTYIKKDDKFSTVENPDSPYTTYEVKKYQDWEVRRFNK
jgi:hypothetical protein